MFISKKKDIQNLLELAILDYSKSSVLLFDSIHLFESILIDKKEIDVDILNLMKRNNMTSNNIALHKFISFIELLENLLNNDIGSNSDLYSSGNKKVYYEMVFDVDFLRDFKTTGFYTNLKEKYNSLQEIVEIFEFSIIEDYSNSLNGLFKNDSISDTQKKIHNLIHSEDMNRFFKDFHFLLHQSMLNKIKNYFGDKIDLKEKKTIESSLEAIGNDKIKYPFFKSQNVIIFKSSVIVPFGYIQNGLTDCFKCGNSNTDFSNVLYYSVIGKIKKAKNENEYFKSRNFTMLSRSIFCNKKDTDVLNFIRENRIIKQANNEKTDEKSLYDFIQNIDGFSLQDKKSNASTYLSILLFLTINKMWLNKEEEIKESFCAILKKDISNNLKFTEIIFYISSLIKEFSYYQKPMKSNNLFYENLLKFVYKKVTEMLEECKNAK